MKRIARNVSELEPIEHLTIFHELVHAWQFEEAADAVRVDRPLHDFAAMRPAEMNAQAAMVAQVRVILIFGERLAHLACRQGVDGRVRDRSRTGSQSG